jgi:hypothetical protein
MKYGIIVTRIDKKGMDKNISESQKVEQKWIGPR